MVKEKEYQHHGALTHKILNGALQNQGRTRWKTSGSRRGELPGFTVPELRNHRTGSQKNLTSGTKRGSVCQGKICGEDLGLMPTHTQLHPGSLGSGRQPGNAAESAELIPAEKTMGNSTFSACTLNSYNHLLYSALLNTPPG